MSPFDLERFYRPAQRPLFQPPEDSPSSVRIRTRGCLECGKEFEVYKCADKTHAYCSGACRAKAHREHACGPRKEPLGPEIRRLARAEKIILGRLQEGPATSRDLMDCGGGVRYGARLFALRQAGHNIEAIHKEGGTWEYRLILP